MATWLRVRVVLETSKDFHATQWVEVCSIDAKNPEKGFDSGLGAPNRATAQALFHATLWVAEVLRELGIEAAMAKAK